MVKSAYHYATEGEREESSRCRTDVQFSEGTSRVNQTKLGEVPLGRGKEKSHSSAAEKGGVLFNDIRGGRRPPLATGDDGWQLPLSEEQPWQRRTKREVLEGQKGAAADVTGEMVEFGAWGRTHPRRGGGGNAIFLQLRRSHAY